MKKRIELGVSPFPTGSASELPASTHEDYENAIRDAGREVGKLYLDQGDIRKAWFYFNMLTEPETVQEYIEQYQFNPDQDCQPIIEIALYQGVHPTKGFDLVLERYGICNAITTYSGQDFSRFPMPSSTVSPSWFPRSTTSSAKGCAWTSSPTAMRSPRMHAGGYVARPRLSFRRGCLSHRHVASVVSLRK